MVWDSGSEKLLGKPEYFPVPTSSSTRTTPTSAATAHSSQTSSTQSAESAYEEQVRQLDSDLSSFCTVPMSRRRLLDIEVL